MTAPTAQRKSLRELRESTGTLFAKNNTLKKITCNTETVKFELDPKGGANSITFVPKECLTQAGFLRLWAKGLVSISDDEDMENEIALLGGGMVAFQPKVYTERHSIAEGVVTGDIEPTYEEAAQNRDWMFRDNSSEQKGNNRYADVQQQARNYSIDTGNSCLFCKEPVLIQQKFLDDGEPPICPEHQDRKGEVASTPQPDGSYYHQVVTIQPVQKSNLPAGG